KQLTSEIAMVAYPLVRRLWSGPRRCSCTGASRSRDAGAESLDSRLVSTYEETQVNFALQLILRGLVNVLCFIVSKLVTDGIPSEDEIAARRRREGGLYMITRLPLDPEKLVTTMLYVASGVSDPTKFKIGKLIFLGDFIHIAQYGRPIVGGR